MQENVVLAYYAQIWKIGPRLPKIEFFEKILFFWKGLQISLLTNPQPPADIKFKSSYAKNTLSKKLNLGLNFSTPSGGVTSPSLKGSMAQTHKLSQMDIQPGGVQDHFLQNVLKFGFGDWKNVYRKSALFRQPA